MITNAARCTGVITSRTAMTKGALNRKKILFTSKLNFKLRKKCETVHMELSCAWRRNLDT
jgi:hypothetical protein